MEIKYALHSANDNPLYLDFWPLVAEIWQKKFNITPILIHVGQQQLAIDQSYGQVVHLPLITEIPEVLQAQWARFWYTQHYGSEICIVSDIDMFPLSMNYFVNQLKKIDETAYVHLNACIDTYGALPACYHVASGNNFKKVLQLSDDWRSAVEKIWQFSQNPPQNFKYNRHVGEWFADEKYSTYQVMDTPHAVKVHLLKRKGGYDAKRIDRSYWKYHDNLLKYDYYIDCHLPRPYQKHQTEINKIMESTLSASSKQPTMFYSAYQKLKAWTA